MKKKKELTKKRIIVMSAVSLFFSPNLEVFGYKKVLHSNEDDDDDSIVFYTFSPFVGDRDGIDEMM